MFHIIMGSLEKSGMHPTVVQISDGSTVASLEGANVKIVLNVDEGILFEGDKDKIESIVRLVKESIIDDLTGLTERLRG